MDSLEEINAIGHRVVHGGEYFPTSVLVDEEVKNKLKKLFDLAPLHNPANVMGIEACEKILPGIPNVVVCDTSFHQSMKPEHFLYALPYEWYEKYQIRRYGAHGTSHKYVSQRMAEILGRSDLKIITCHLGNGASITAVENGKSVDTSMGFTPLAGVTMGTRSGDIDPAVLQYLMDKLNIDIDEMLDILNKKSGLLGLTGISSDMRDLEDNMDNEDVKIALDIFADRIRKYIASYVSTMNGVDAIVFTAGIGENDANARANIINGMTWFGCEIDPEKNDVRGKERVISTEDSKVKVLLVPTDEELVIARDVESLRKND